MKTKRKPAAPNETTDPVFRTIHQLLSRANSGDEEAQSRLREILKQSGAAPVLAATGDLALAAQDKFIARYAGDSHILREAVQLRLDQLRAELAAPKPSPLEKLLVERVLVCWLQVHIADCTSARAGDRNLTEGEYYQRNQSRAQVRYLAAIKTLVLIRKLLQPTLSPLDLASRPVNETPGNETVLRRDGSKPARGVPVEN